jgi:tetratricopeptide (TPR) repeat protein
MTSQAVAIWDDLARNHPGSIRYKFILAYNLTQLGQFSGQARKFPQAEQALTRSIAVLEELLVDHPQDIQKAHRLGHAYTAMTDVLLLRGDQQSGLVWAGRAIDLFRRLARRDPHNHQVGRSALWKALAGRAETLMRLGRHAEALTDFGEIVELTQSTDYGDLFQAFHALTKARLGDPTVLAGLGDRARRTVQSRAGRESLSKSYNYYMTCYDAACIHAALAAPALQNPVKPEPERRRLARVDFDRALEFLDKSRADGDFQGMIGREEIEREVLLDPLRGHPRFQLLMMDLAFPADPFRP